MVRLKTFQSTLVNIFGFAHTVPNKHENKNWSLTFRFVKCKGLR